jgi:hypothetical protein
MSGADAPDFAIADKDARRLHRGLRPHLIASGLVGEPTAPVIGIAGATNMNS